MVELKILLEIMDTRYKEMQRCCSSSSRKYREGIMLSLIQENPELGKYWGYDGSQRLICERFYRKKSCSSEKPEFEWETPFNHCGLYLVGTTTFNPFTKETFYWIKVGKTLTLNDRIKQYKTHNPAIWVSDFFQMETSDYLEKADRLEKSCHSFLKMFSIEKARNTKEWFRVSEADYLNICAKGFNIFPF